MAGWVSRNLHDFLQQLGRMGTGRATLPEQRGHVPRPIPTPTNTPTPIPDIAPSLTSKVAPLRPLPSGRTAQKIFTLARLKSTCHGPPRQVSGASTPQPARNHAPAPKPVSGTPANAPPRPLYPPALFPRNFFRPGPFFSMSSSDPRKDDIRGQLSDIQRRLFGAGRPRPAGPDFPPMDGQAPARFPGGNRAPGAETGARPPVPPAFPPAPPPAADRAAENTAHALPPTRPAVPAKPGPAPSNSAVLRRNNGRPQAATAAPRGPRVLPQPQPPLRPESKGQDMDFVVGLSENLLSECRRLTAENHALQARMKSQAAELAESRSQAAALATTRTVAASTELGLLDKNWELEARNAALQEHVEALKAANDKLVRTHNDSTLRISALQRDADEHQMKAATLASDLRLVQDATHRRVAEMAARVDELSDENDALHAQVLGLEAAAAAVGAPRGALAPPLPAGLDTATDALDLDAILHDLAAFLAEPAVRDPDGVGLEVHTLRASLAHSSRTVSRLRAALLRAKAAPAPSARSTPKSARKTRPKDAAGRTPALATPAKAGSKFIVVNHDDEESPSRASAWPQEDNWEDFIGLGAAGATPSKPARRVVDESDEDLPEDLGIGLELRRTNSYLHDTDSSELDFEAPPKPFKQRVLSHELSRAAEPITEAQVQQFARDNHLVLLTLEDYAKLEYNDVLGMDTARITAVAESKGFVLLSKAEHDELLGEEEMKARLLSRGIVTIPELELDGLKQVKQHYEHPDFAFLCEHLKAKGHEAVDAEHLASLKKSDALVLSPPRSFLVSRCKAANLYPLPTEEYKRLKALETEYDQPSKEYLTKKANEMGLFVSPSHYIDELEKKALDPDASHVTSKAEALGLKVLSAEKLSSLESPDLKAVAERAKALGHMVLPSHDYNDLHALATNPPVSHLRDMSHKHDCLLLSNDEYQKLRLPDLESIQSRAASLGHHVLPAAKLRDLETLAHNPPIEHVRERAAGHTLIPVPEFEALRKLAHEPSLAHVQKHAETHKLVTLSGNEYTSLYKQAHEPSLEYLAGKATEREYELVKMSELEKLKQLSESPDLDYLKTKALGLGHELVPEDKLSELQTLAHKPDHAHLRHMARISNMCILEIEEFEHLQSLAHSPDRSHLIGKASQMGLCVISNEDLKTLQRRAQEPLLEEIKADAQRHGFIAVSLFEFEELERKVSEPSVEELAEISAAHGKILVDKNDYQTLKHSADEPSLLHMKTICDGLGYEIVDQVKFSALNQEVNEPSVEQLRLRAEVMGMKIIKDKDYELLHSLAHDPHLDHLVDHAKKYDHVLVSDSEYNSMNAKAESPDFHHIEKKATLLDMVVLPREMHMKTQALLEFPSLEYLREKASSIDHILVKNADFQNPSLEYIREKAALHDSVAIKKSELENLQSKLDAPPAEYIKTKATQVGLITLTLSAHKELTSLATSPPESHVKDVAAKLGLVSLSPTEVDQLKRDAENIPEETIVSKAASLGLATISAVDLKELKRKSHAPTVSELKQFAKASNMDLIKIKELEALRNHIDSPEIAYIEEKAAQQGHVLVAQEKLAELDELALRPTLSQLKEAASKKDLVIIPKFKYEETVRLAFGPSVEHIAKLASKTGSLIILATEYEAVKEKALRPSIEHLKSCAESHLHIVLPQTDYEELSRLAHQPSLERVNELARNQGYVVTPKSEFETIQSLANNASLDRAVELARANDSVIVSSKDYDELTQRAKSPTLTQLKESAAIYEHVVVPKADHDTLTRLVNEPSLSEIQNNALSFERILITNEEHENLDRQANAPSLSRVKEHAHTFNHSLLPVLDHESLIKLANDPPMEHILRLAKGLDHKLVPVQEYDSLKAKAERPSMDQIKDFADVFHSTVISTDKYAELTAVSSKPSLDHLREKAKNHSCVVILETEYSDLQSLAHNPDADHIQKKAQILGLSLLLETELQLLRTLAERPDIDFVKTHADRLEHDVIEKDELLELKRSVENPKFDFLCNRISSHGYVAIPSLEFEQRFEDEKRMANMKLITIEEYDHLSAISSLPSLEFLKEKAREKEHVLLSQSKYDEWRESLQSPKYEYLVQKANNLGYDVIESTQLKTLQNSLDEPSHEYLVEKATSKKLVLLPSAELLLLNRQIEEPLLEYLREKSRKFDHAIIPELELHSLKSIVNDPTTEFLADKLHSKSMTAIDDDELKSLHKTEELLNNPTLEYLLKQAKVKNFELVENSKFESLLFAELSLESPSDDYLHLHAKKKDCTLVLNSKLAELENSKAILESPSLEYLSQHANTFDQKLLSFASLLELQHFKNLFLSPSLEYLSDQALLHNHKVVLIEQHESMQKCIDLPGIEYIREKAILLGHVLISAEKEKDLYTLEQEYQSPTVEYLSQKVLMHDCEVVPISELTSLKHVKTSFESPSIEYLREQAFTQGHELLTEDEVAHYEEAEELAKAPPLGVVQERAVQLGYVVLTSSRVNALEKLEASLEAPDLEYLRVKLDKIGQTLMDSVTFETWSARNAKDSKELAAEDGYFVLAQEEYNTLQESLTSPLLEYLAEKATAHKCVVVSEESNASLLKQIESPSLESIKAHADILDHILMSKGEFRDCTESLDSKLEKAGLVALSKDEHAQILSKLCSPDLEFLIEKASLYEARVIQNSEYDALQAKANESLTSKAEADGMVLLERNVLADLHDDSQRSKKFSDLLETPDMGIVTDLAAKLKCTIVPQEDFDELEAQLMESVHEKALKLSLIAIPLTDFNRLKTESEESVESKAAKENKTVINSTEYERSLGLDGLHDLAIKHGYATLPAQQLSSLKAELDKDLKTKALEANMAIAPLAEYKKLLSNFESPTLEFLAGKATSFNKELIDIQELAALKLEASSILNDKAARAGLVVIPVAEFDHLHSKAHLPSISDVKSAAVHHGYELVKTAELNELNEKANRTIDDHIASTNLRVIPNDEFDEMLLRANKPSLYQISQNAEEHGMTLVLTEEFEQMKRDSEEPLELKAEKDNLALIDSKELTDLRHIVESPSGEYLADKARAIGSLIIPVVEYDHLKSQSGKSLDELARESGFVLLKNEEHTGLLSQLEDSQKFKLPTNDEELDFVKNELRARGYEVVSKTKYAFLQSNSLCFSPEELTEAARSKGLIVVSEDGELESESSPDEVIDWLKHKGFEVKMESTTPEFADAQETIALNLEELKLSAERLGMVCVEQPVYQDIVEKSKIQEDKDLLTAAAAALSLAVLPSADLTNLKQSLIDKDSTISSLSQKPETEVSKASLLQNLRRLDMVVLEKAEYQQLKSCADQQNETMSEDDLRAKAEELGFSVVPGSQYHELKNAQDTLKDKSMFVKAAKDWNLICVPATAFVPTTVARTPDVEKVSLIPTSYYEKLSRLESLNIDKVSEDVFRSHAQKRGYVKHSAISKSPLLNLDSEESSLAHSPLTSAAASSSHSKPPLKSALPHSKSVRSEMTVESHNSAIDSLTGLSIATNISFTDRSMIPAITQVVIGEYLFKYYRKLGPLSSISASRHERYFWVHPYSLTLYWSSSNPVLTNPSEVKVRAMAIESVESVDDNNPLPTGLHYKSIIVRCKLKTIKITCPTRQRHNTWYNALRYLVNRSINELNFGRGDPNRVQSAQDHNNMRHIDDEEDDEDVFHPNAQFDASTRHAFPRSSSIMKSRSFGRLPSIRR
ncbi:hypothetical protein METBIDRAFT_9111 [Metschnikowia bicuspidata var. bicuspidata NRRL YB-4993]|uniref:PH domain-containing protein n=1 Tax=Metschnikowia bicuspidata var. bicuspidata NRRL YB-4993 TaxID=869754 RepID=A0A1A0HFS5_9ASCO|nr:hypothetical protein METBIDRAFT_9111 [Metschnikowia bicuspidata var. bicuspidata NRRL YB-4993]OBA22747.1 hypothetical protein METBIDRAFT_9111 [Metschnikowia bicuspidata var. bicuspidata NRRL YB-4993]